MNCIAAQPIVCATRQIRRAVRSAPQAPIGLGAARLSCRECVVSGARVAVSGRGAVAISAARRPLVTVANSQATVADEEKSITKASP